MCIVRPVSLTSGILHGKETQEAQLQDLDTGRSERAEKALSREDASGQDREDDEAQRGHGSDEGLSARFLHRPSSPESSLIPISDVRDNTPHVFFIEHRMNRAPL
jgi:hypothetical protein